jgi:exosortase family protein XrtM
MASGETISPGNRQLVPDRGTRRAVARFLIIFATVFTTLQLTFLGAEGSHIEHWVIDVGTVQAAATIINTVDPAAAVRADGPRLASPAASLNVLRGCEGTELYFLWVAAVLAFPAAWSLRLLALMAGLGAAWILNQLRVISLFYVARDHHEWFALLHGYVAPVLLVLVLGLGFAWYVGRVPRR